MCTVNQLCSTHSAFVDDDVGLMEKSSAGNVDAGKQLKGLAGLPAELLDAVLRQLDASSRLPVFRTSKLLATALLRVVPWIRLTYPTQSDISGQHLRELPPFLTEVLQKRQQPKLHLALRPANGLTEAIQQRQRAEPAAAAADAARLLAWMLGAVPLCGAVDRLTISWSERPDLPWEPVFSAALATSFPALTSLTFYCVSMTIHQLAKVINHPLLVPRLLRLNLLDASITHQGDVGRSPFIGSRLQELSLKDGDLNVLGLGAATRHLRHRSGQVPLPPHLTQLKVTCSYEDVSTGPSMGWDWVTLAVAVSSLTQLRHLQLNMKKPDIVRSSSEPLPLLQALAHLPSLHTLAMDHYVLGQEQLDTLLALTQITRLRLLTFTGLTSSRASADCSWRWLSLGRLDWVTAAYLPLHSLTHPMRLHQLVKDTVEDPTAEVLAAAELNLCVSNKAGLVLYGGMYLSKATVNQLTYLYLTHSRRTAQQPLQPTVASSSHSGPSTSLASSGSPKGHITPGGPGGNIGLGVQQGGLAAAGVQALMQRLGRCVKVLYIDVRGLSGLILSEANQQALFFLFPKADIRFW
ncbi:hypothetical protein QJQ45_003916 [Haematococcus lacustris]|nr:hypothetical protein QJQ45_003916 [Haematococcus lacustris]